MNRRDFMEALSGIAVFTAVVATADPTAAAEELPEVFGFGRDAHQMPDLAFFDPEYVSVILSRSTHSCGRTAGHEGTCTGLPRIVAAGEGWSQMCYEHSEH